MLSVHIDHHCTQQLWCVFYEFVPPVRCLSGRVPGKRGGGERQRGLWVRTIGINIISRSSTLSPSRGYCQVQGQGAALVGG